MNVHESIQVLFDNFSVNCSKVTEIDDFQVDNTERNHL